MRNVWTLALAALLALLLAGCGGGGGNGGNNNNATANVTLGVNWAARSRAVNGPSSALSLVATIPDGSASGEDVILRVNRQDAPAAYTQTYNFPDPVRTGSRAVQIRFFAQRDGGGSLVGTAGANVTVDADGADVGDVTTTGTITSVAVVEGQTVDAGETKPLMATARAADNSLVAVDPKAVTYAVTAGGENAALTGGDIQGRIAGTVTLTATVDGIASQPAVIPIRPVAAALAAQENGALYGIVRLTVRGLAAGGPSPEVKVGDKTAFVSGVQGGTGETPAGSVDFRVPTGLTAGAQNLVVTVNGQPSAPFALTVADANPYATFTLENGRKFVAVLRRDKSPDTVDNFVGLATGTKTWTPTFGSAAAGIATNTPLYDGVTFHRVTDISEPTDAALKIIQAGDPITKLSPPPAGWSPGTGGPGFTIPFEVNDLLHEDGALSMARSTSLNSAGSQFFVCDGPHPFLNTTTNNGQPTGGYVVFGKVIENLDNARAITQGTVLTSVTISGRVAAP